MTLESLAVSGVHGRLTVDIDTQRPVFITGPNRAGKSTLLRALAALASCSMKSLGDQPPGASISATLDGVAHRMVSGVGGKLTHEIGGVPTAPKEATAARAVAFGEASAWSVDAFLRESAARRSAFVAERIMSESFSPQDVADALQAAGETLQGVAAELLVDARAPRVLDVLVARAAEEARTTQAEYLRLSRAVEAEDAGRAKLRLPPGTVAQWRGEVASLTERIGALKAEQQGAQRAAAQRAAGEARKAAIARRVAELDSQAAEDIALEPLQAEVEAAETRLTAAWEARSQHMAAEGAALAASQRARAHMGEVDAETRELVARHEAGVKVARLIDATEALLEAVQGLASLDDLREEALSAIADIGRPPRLSQVSAAKARLTEAQEAFAAANAALREATERSASAKSEAERAEAAAHNARGAFGQARARRDALALGSARNATERTALLEELETLRAASESTAVSRDTADLIAGLQRQLDVAQSNADELNDAEHRTVVLETRRQERDAAQRRATRMRELGRKLGEVRDVLLARQVDPITDVASEVTHRVLGATLRIVAGEVLITDHRVVTYNVDTASDGERVVALIALAVAVRTRLPGWRPAIIDRLDALTPDLASALMRAMYDLWAVGRIDTLIVASHVDIDPLCEGAALDYTRVVLEAP